MAVQADAVELVERGLDQGRRCRAWAQVEAEDLRAAAPGGNQQAVSGAVVGEAIRCLRAGRYGHGRDRHAGIGNVDRIDRMRTEIADVKRIDAVRGDAVEESGAAQRQVHDRCGGVDVVAFDVARIDHVQGAGQQFDAVGRSRRGSEKTQRAGRVAYLDVAVVDVADQRAVEAGVVLDAFGTAQGLGSRDRRHERADKPGREHTPRDHLEPSARVFSRSSSRAS